MKITKADWERHMKQQRKYDRQLNFWLGVMGVMLLLMLFGYVMGG